jgi:hypothetical protein
MDVNLRDRRSRQYKFEFMLIQSAVPIRIKNSAYSVRIKKALVPHRLFELAHA